ncbi:class I SAM-dependent methyltransferase [Actinomadura latina]|uniref:Class I SAM-dependent methyltransferase n=1 Tax=Actinomadura latina TaxID=163603 RepID=A0A846YVX5_9ACTN|nr:class I SAM-dependent methyltransferase [Actinomadura latina]NKZ02825.1 class I SAM-dependent methyltransferase [Actinomadura latina]
MTYPFADRAAEDERLVAQGRLFDPLTRRVLRHAGLAPGMRVLDLGSGAGNVARVAAELVGPDGAVVGVERDPAAAELARRRTDAPNVEYRVGDVQTLDGIEDDFDAVVGRLFLMYLPDPAAVIRGAAAHVRPGGLICMHEADLAYLPAVPETPLWNRAHGWFLDALEKAGFEPRMGPALFTAFREAGLPAPRLQVETFAAGGPDAPAWGWANVIGATVPLMERTGIASHAEVDPATLADRLLADTLAHDGCVFGPPMTGAWTTAP